MSPYLVFDLDGTISDPALGVGRSINYALRYFGYPPWPEREVSRYIGPPLDESFRDIVGPASNEQISQLLAKYRERYAKVGFAENALYAGIPKLLQSLSSRGLQCGICTSKRVDFAEQILDLFQLRTHFRFVDGGEIGIGKKEQLAALLAAGTIPPDAVMIGDRALDVSAAHANGLAGIGVLWGHGSREELEAESAEAILEVPGDLLLWLDRPR